jgi:hypothetical protein
MVQSHPIARRSLLIGGAAAVGAAVGSIAPTSAGADPRHRPRPASLELDESSYVELDADFLRTEEAQYTRIKKMPDGSYLLLYQEDKYSWSIFSSISEDLKTWSPPQKLWATHPINDGADDRCFASPDACVLDNGDVLAVCSYRVDQGFSSRMELDGVAVRRSRDNGRTWGPASSIYTGATWEPCITQLGTGEVQVYFTHPAPKLAVDHTAGSTGVALVRSFDRGRTWVPDVRDYPYAAQRVAQQYTRDSDEGVRMYTDQMPSALEVGHGGRIALAMESHLADGDFMISLAHTRHDWPRALGMEEEGPRDRQSNLFPGAAPQLAQFPSGETVLAYNHASRQKIRLGDRHAREFGEPEEFLPGDGYWGSVEVISRDRLATTMAAVRSDGNRIMIAALDLVR